MRTQIVRAALDEHLRGGADQSAAENKEQRAVAQGTGMGLSIARAIVEAHGGSINVTSQLKHGSVFAFTLPIVRTAGEAR